MEDLRDAAEGLDELGRNGRSTSNGWGGWPQGGATSKEAEDIDDEAPWLESGANNDGGSGSVSPCRK